MLFLFSDIVELSKKNQIVIEDIKSLHKIGYEVESIINYKEVLKDFIVGEIIECNKVEGSTKLNLCSVYDGTENLSVICGASNVRVGLKIVLARVGVEMPNGLLIQNRKVFGKESSGMICSAEELGLYDKNDGIYELSDNAKAGENISKYIDLDTLIDVSFTPDKFFSLSVFGILNELLRVKELDSIELSRFNFNNINYIKSSEFTTSHYWIKCMNVENTTNLAWLQKKLHMLNISSHNFLVDILNYVTYITGQPFHVYDADKIKGDLSFIRAKKDEVLLGLDDIEYKISVNDLIVVDESNQVCAIAGLIGSKNTSINQNTKNIIIEAAAFKKSLFVRSVVNQSNAYNLYSKGVSGLSTYSSLQYLLHMINQYIAIESHSIRGSKYEVHNRILEFDVKQYDRLIGEELDINKFISFFNRNGFKTSNVTQDIYNIYIPDNRNDIQVSQDIIGEYLRFQDYHTMSLMNIDHCPRDISKSQTYFNLNIADLMSKVGFDEVMTWSFSEQYKEEGIKIKNPISSDLSVLNTSNYMNLLKIAKKNLSYMEEGFKIFTIAPVFNQDLKGIKQKNCLSGIAHVCNLNKYHYKSNSIDYLDIKGDIEVFLAQLGFNNIAFQASKYKEYSNEYQCAGIYINDNKVGVLTGLYPEENLIFFELDIDLIFRLLNPITKTIISDRHPIFRDFCIVVDKSVKTGDILAYLNKIKYVTKVFLIDKHDGNNTITIRTRVDSDVNLSKEEIKCIEDEVESIIKNKFNYKIKEI